MYCRPLICDISVIWPGKSLSTNIFRLFQRANLQKPVGGRLSFDKEAHDTLRARSALYVGIAELFFTVVLYTGDFPISKPRSPHDFECNVRT